MGVQKLIQTDNSSLFFLPLTKPKPYYISLDYSEI